VVAALVDEKLDAALIVLIIIVIVLVVLLGCRPRRAAAAAVARAAAARGPAAGGGGRGGRRRLVRPARLAALGLEELGREVRELERDKFVRGAVAEQHLSR
jgi:hypothetical protein